MSEEFTERKHSNKFIRNKPRYTQPKQNKQQNRKNSYWHYRKKWKRDKRGEKENIWIGSGNIRIRNNSIRNRN